jgi:hypothetical protein
MMPLEQYVSLDAQALTKMWVKHSPRGEGMGSETPSQYGNGHPEIVVDVRVVSCYSRRAKPALWMAASQPDSKIPDSHRFVVQAVQQMIAWFGKQVVRSTCD